MESWATLPEATPDPEVSFVGEGKGELSDGYSCGIEEGEVLGVNEGIDVQYWETICSKGMPNVKGKDSVNASESIRASAENN